MKTIVINTSKEAKNTKLDVLFKAPFDHRDLLWVDSRLTELGKTAELIKRDLLEETDTVERDYNLIVLIDTFQLPYGHDKTAIGWYKMLLERYVLTNLVEELHSRLNLTPEGVCIYFVDSARTERGLNIDSLAKNPAQQKKREQQEAAAQYKESRDMLKHENGDLTDDGPYEIKRETVEPTPSQLVLMDIFGWTKNITKDTLSWKMKTTVSGDDFIDFSDIFRDTSRAVNVSDANTDILGVVLKEINARPEEWQLSCVGRMEVKTPVCFVSRENEQSKLEGFFCVFADIFTCVQKKQLISEATVLDREQICRILVNALKKYKHFSKEENITVDFEPIEKVFEKRDTIFERRKEEAKKQNRFKGMTAEEIAKEVMLAHKPKQYDVENSKLRGSDRKFYELAAEIFGNYDTDVIRAQNNEIVKSCLEGLWSWRDKQTRENFKTVVDGVVEASGNSTGIHESSEVKRETMEFLHDEYEAKRDVLIEQVTDAEKQLAGNSNILLETKDLMIKYGDWMRKGMWSWVSLIGAVFTVIATVFPFFYTDWSIGNTGVAFHVNLFAIVGLCAFLYAVASGIYIGYINRRKLELISKLGKLRDKSEQERKTSIIALYRYYTETIVEAESLGLLWREIRRRDRENAKKGMKRNYHIKRLKSLAEQVERFITMLKLDVSGSVTVEAEDRAEYARRGLKIDGEESYYQQENRRVYCLLPEEGKLLSEKGDTKKE